MSRTFGSSLKETLQRGGYVLVHEFVTPDGRLAVHVQVEASGEVVPMFHSDALELARGAATLEAVRFRNRHVTFQS